MVNVVLRMQARLTDGNGQILLNDPILLLGYLFSDPGPELLCLDAADFDDSGVVAINDAIALLTHLFAPGAPPPAPPFPECGQDPEADDLTPCVYPPRSCL